MTNVISRLPVDYFALKFGLDLTEVEQVQSTPMARKRQTPTRGDRMDARRKQLGMSWEEVAKAAGLDRVTVFNIRNGANGHPKSIRNIEAALGWTLGSIAEIDAGREPVVVTDPLASPTAFFTPAVETDDPAVQLRALRQRMGAIAFWREIEVMREGETTTVSGSA
jgi:transcriptional regulator with XRE-family HTH domain